MASTQEATPAPPAAAADELQKRALIHNVSIGMLIVGPILIALPPRKLDIYTFSLLGLMSFSGNNLVREHTGRGIVDHVNHRMNVLVAPYSTGVPAGRAQEVQKILREEKAARLAAIQAEAQNGKGKLSAEQEGKVQAALRELAEAKEKAGGVLEKVWMGDAKEDWRAKRDREEKEALEEGRGYGGLIMDQIWEVWNWGRDKVEEVKEEDEKVVKANEEARKE